MPDDSGVAPLRVLIVAGNGIVGGMESTIARLAERLPSSAFSLVALCPFEGPFTARLREHGLPVHIAPMGERLRWHSVQRAVSLAREHEVHVIHAHMGPAHVVAGLAGRAAATPVLATVHSMHLSMLDLEIHRLAATHLCVVSEAARAQALAVGVSPAKLSVIRNGVDAEEFRPRPKAVVRTSDTLTVGFVGRLSPEKNPELFLRAAALVHANAPAIRFVMIGDGPLRLELEALATHCASLTWSRSPANAAACPSDITRSTWSSARRGTRARRSPCSRRWRAACRSSLRTLGVIRNSSRPASPDSDPAGG